MDFFDLQLFAEDGDVTPAQDNTMGDEINMDNVSVTRDEDGNLDIDFLDDDAMEDALAEIEPDEEEKEDVPEDEQANEEDTQYVEIDGEKVPLSEVQEAYKNKKRYHADYTRKTQELAEQRKKLEQPATEAVATPLSHPDLTGLEKIDLSDFGRVRDFQGFRGRVSVRCLCDFFSIIILFKLAINSA